MHTMNLRGEQGGDYIDDTDAHTPSTGQQWVGGLCVVETEIAAITQPRFENEAALVGVTLPQGYPLYGHITSIQLTSGTVQLFNLDREG